MIPVHLVWFRQDLRAIDNRALWHACESESAIVIGVFVHTPEQYQKHHMSPGGLYFMAKHIKALSETLSARHIPLFIIESTDFKASVADLLKFIEEKAVTKLFFNKQYEVNEQNRDHQIIDAISTMRSPINVKTFDDSVLMSPGRVITQNGEMFKVYTPFRNALLKQLTDADIHVTQAPKARLHQSNLSANQLEDSNEKSLDAMLGLYASLTPQSIKEAMPAIGEEAAIAKLRAFCESKMAEYALMRDFPAQDNTSQLSAYLAYGILSPRQCIRRIMLVNPNVLEDKKSGAFSWLNELIWREFYRHLLVAFPFLVKHQPMISWTQQVKWRNDPEQLQAWKTGNTGYPLVDAAMRQLNQTGWMHNRLRMVVASFLVKDLLIDWRLGEQYFMSKLIDGDFAANNGGWQWAASTGCDAAPYFRIFNPTTQSEKFDPTGEFIRRYVPELKHLSDKVIHAPYEYGSGVGLAYPRPIISHSDARKITLDAYEKAKNNALE